MARLTSLMVTMLLLGGAACAAAAGEAAYERCIGRLQNQAAGWYK